MFKHPTHKHIIVVYFVHTLQVCSIQASFLHVSINPHAGVWNFYEFTQNLAYLCIILHMLEKFFLVVMCMWHVECSALSLKLFVYHAACCIKPEAIYITPLAASSPKLFVYHTAR